MIEVGARVRLAGTRKGVGTIRELVAPKTWQVIAVDAAGHGHGQCGHRHETDLDAVRCPWTPDPWPVCCDLLVRQVRDTVGQSRRWKRPQLELFGSP